jgi:hypothetical protein
MVAKVDTVNGVDNNTFLIIPFPLSATNAKVMSDEMTTPWGLRNVADVPAPFPDPDVPAAEPATNDDVTTPPVKVSFLILFPMYSVTNAKVPSDEMSRPFGELNAMLVPVPSAYAPVAVPEPAILTTVLSNRFNFLIE